MKVAMWGVGLFVLGVLGIVLINLFGNITVTNQLNYTTMKNAVEASMYDALDIAHYRAGFCICGDKLKNASGTVTFSDDKEYKLYDITYDSNRVAKCPNENQCRILYGEYRVNPKVFSESLTRRVAEMVNNNKTYNIVIQDIIEYPPKVSVRVDSEDDEFSPTDKSGGYTITNQIDAIIESHGGVKVVINEVKPTSNPTQQPVSTPTSNPVASPSVCCTYCRFTDKDCKKNCIAPRNCATCTDATCSSCCYDTYTSTPKPVQTPTQKPTATPTEAPTPTVEATPEPTVEPTPDPTPAPCIPVSDDSASRQWSKCENGIRYKYYETKDANGKVCSVEYVEESCSTPQQTKKPSGGGGCFLAGTKVAIRGGYKDIEKLFIGDYVLTYNEKLKRNEYKKVLRVFRLKNLEEVLYTINTDDTSFSLTGHHRVYTYHNGKYEYVAAQDLNIGDVVLYSNGEYHEIISTQHKKINNVVYNLTIEDNNNFYVGEKEILVHNMTATYFARDGVVDDKDRSQQFK